MTARDSFVSLIVLEVLFVLFAGPTPLSILKNWTLVLTLIGLIGLVFWWGKDIAAEKIKNVEEFFRYWVVLFAVVLLGSIIEAQGVFDSQILSESLQTVDLFFGSVVNPVGIGLYARIWFDEQKPANKK